MVTLTQNIEDFQKDQELMLKASITIETLRKHNKELESACMLLESEKSTMQNQIKTLAFLMGNLLSTFEGGFDKDNDYSYEQLDEYIQTAKYMKRAFNRAGDVITQAEDKMFSMSTGL